MRPQLSLSAFLHLLRAEHHKEFAAVAGTQHLRLSRPMPANLQSKHSCMQAPTATRSLTRQCSKRAATATHASTQRLPCSKCTHPTLCSTPPWAQLPCQRPCVLTALRCPLSLKPTLRLPQITTCSMPPLLATRAPSPPGTPQTHGYPLRGRP